MSTGQVIIFNYELAKVMPCIIKGVSYTTVAEGLKTIDKNHQVEPRYMHSAGSIIRNDNIEIWTDSQAH